MRKCLSLVVAALVFSIFVGPTAQRTASAEKVTMVVGPYVGYVQIWNMKPYAKKYGIDLELRKMFTFTQMQQAVELGQAQAGTVGYQNLVLMANAGGPRESPGRRRRLPPRPGHRLSQGRQDLQVEGYRGEDHRARARILRGLSVPFCRPEQRRRHEEGQAQRIDTVADDASGP